MEVIFGGNVSSVAHWHNNNFSNTEGREDHGFYQSLLRGRNVKCDKKNDWLGQRRQETEETPTPLKMAFPLAAETSGTSDSLK